MEDTANIRHLAKNAKDLTELGIELGAYFNPIGNFSLLPTTDGHWLAVFRRFQYYIEGDRYCYLSSPQMFYKDRHEHLFAMLDKDFNLVEKIGNFGSTYYDAPEWKTQYDYGGKSPFLEDARFTYWKGDGIYLTSAIYWYDESRNKNWSVEIQKVSFLGNGIVARHHWNSLEHNIEGVQKNWMSVPDRPGVFVIGTSTNGARAIDIGTDEVKDIGDFDPDDLYCGNANLMEVDGGYMAITHRYFHGDRGRRTYHNFVVQYDKSLKPVKISNPFKLCDEGIEFITWWQMDGDDVLIGVTEMDDKPMVMRLGWHEFLRRVNMIEIEVKSDDVQ